MLSTDKIAVLSSLYEVQEDCRKLAQHIQKLTDAIVDALTYDHEEDEDE